MTIFGVICALLCIIYYLILVIYSGPGTTFVGYWLFFALCFGLLALFFFLDKRYGLIIKIPKPIIISVCVVIFLGITLFTVLFGTVISGMKKKPDGKVDYCIVLGASIKGEKITKSLKMRLEKAYEYYEENNDVMIIVTGGKGEGENVTEASAMAKDLIEKGLPESHIILEEKATNTKENLEYSYEIIKDRGDEEAAIAICSSSFHIARALKLAEHQGINQAQGLAAPCDKIVLFNYMIRDSLAIFKEFLLGNIGIN